MAAAYLLWPTYNYYRLDQERKELLTDSVRLAQWDASNGEAYSDARAGRLKLGLDLRGGMYVTMEVDVLKLIEESADPQSIDADFIAILDKTRKETNNTDLDVLDVFLKNFRASGKSLLQYFIVSSQADPTEATIEAKLRADADDAVNQALEVITQRINKYQVSEPNIQKIGTRRLQIELPDVKDESEVRSLLSGSAKLSFKRVFTGKEVIRALFAVDKALQGKSAADTSVVADSTSADSTAKTDTTKVASADTSKATDTAKTTADTGKKKHPYEGLSKEQQQRKAQQENPFTQYITGYVAANKESKPEQFDFLAKTENDFPDGYYSFVIPEVFVKRVTEMLDKPEVRRAFSGEIEIMVGAKPINNDPTKKGNGIFSVFGVAREAELSGDVIEDARANFDPTNNQPVVHMQMDADGAERWSQITEANIGKQIAIILDGRVYSAPNVQGKIPNGSSQISGQADIKEAQVLAVVLKAGALKAPVQIIEERLVGPSLGEDSIKRGVTSSLISFAIVIGFMLLYYAFGGGIADLALLMNVLLVIAGLAAFGGTLTLPGIAGLILATAMAVDANILIFERIREELYAGKSLRAAVDAGFSKAWSAIIDSNVTNLLSGVVMWALGSGPVVGFAITLILGVVMTLFTAVVVTRAMFEIIIAGGATSFNFGQRKIA